MAGGKEPIEVKFRLFDGTDIGPNKYDPSTTVTALKEFVLARWPQGPSEETVCLPSYPVGVLGYSPHFSGPVPILNYWVLSRWCFYRDKDIIPKTLNDVKLINAGRILENNKTLAESRVPVGEVPGGVITMHVVVRPPQSDKSEKHLSNSPKQNRCGCTIL